MLIDSDEVIGKFESAWSIIKLDGLIQNYIKDAQKTKVVNIAFKSNFELFFSFPSYLTFDFTLPINP